MDAQDRQDGILSYDILLISLIWVQDFLNRSNELRP